MDGRRWLGDLVYEKADLHAGIRNGGRVLSAFVVERGATIFVVYMRGNWVRGRGFRIIRSWRGLAGDRTFKHAGAALGFIRSFGVQGRVTIYPAGDSRLRLFVGVLARDLATDRPPPQTTPRRPQPRVPKPPRSRA